MSIIFEHYKQLTKLLEQRKAKDKAKTSRPDVCISNRSQVIHNSFPLTILD